MTDRLSEIRERLEEATPGPWAQGMVGDRLLPEVDYPAGFGFVQVTLQSDDGAGGVGDAAFIAHAPEDIAYLLAEVERLRQASEAMQVRTTRIIERLRRRAGDDFLHGDDMVLCADCQNDLRWRRLSYLTSVHGGECADCGTAVAALREGEEDGN